MRIYVCRHRYNIYSFQMYVFGCVYIFIYLLVLPSVHNVCIVYRETVLSIRNRSCVNINGWLVEMLYGISSLFGSFNAKLNFKLFSLV